MLRNIRITIGSILSLIGVVFFILPGSILFLLAGLFILSYDVPAARKGLKWCQNSISRSARALDRYLLKRKLRN